MRAESRGYDFGDLGAIGAIGWRGLALLMLGGLQAGLLVAGSGAAVATQLLVVLGAAGVGSLALLWIASDSRFSRTPLWWILGLALVLRLVAVQADPLLEDDHYRYLWDGFRTVQGFDPYRLAPSAYFGAQELSVPWQQVLSGINNPDIPTLYGPVLQALFAVAHLLAPGRIGAIQGLLLLVDMGCLVLLARHAVGARWLLAYALHPLILKEAMASAHPDGLVALWLLLASMTWRRGRLHWTGALLGLAVATKMAALVVVPLFLFGPPRGGSFWRMARALALGFVAVLGLAYAPFVAVGGSDIVGLQAFAAQWRFNPLLFRVVEAGVPTGMARPVALGLIAAGVAAVAWHWRAVSIAGAEGHDAPPVDRALLLLILLAPVVNPWYALWALAPAVAARRPLVAVLGCVGVLAYLNGSVLHEAGWLAATEPAAPFAVAWPIALAQVAALALAVAWTHGRNRPKKHSARPELNRPDF